MMTPKLREYLDSQKVNYETVAHLAAVTAQEVAARAHVRGKEFAKTVVVKLDDRLVMAVLPAPMKVDLEQLQKITGASHAELAAEADFSDLFAECEVGAMPPFGNLYGLERLRRRCPGGRRRDRVQRRHARRTGEDVIQGFRAARTSGSSASCLGACRVERFRVPAVFCEGLCRYSSSVIPRRTPPASALCMPPDAGCNSGSAHPR